VLAVLEAHCGVKLSGYDVYLNVAGGLRIQEPAADLAAAAALVSSLVNAPLPTDAVYFGEISLFRRGASGGAKPRPRLKEAAKLGFGRANPARIGARRARRRRWSGAEQRRRIDQSGRRNRRARHAQSQPGGQSGGRSGEKCHTRPDSGGRMAKAA